MKFIKQIFEFIVKLYTIYSDFIHSIFRDELGDFVIFLINIAVIIAVVKVVASVAFQTKSRG